MKRICLMVLLLAQCSISQPVKKQSDCSRARKGMPCSSAGKMCNPEHIAADMSSFHYECQNGKCVGVKEYGLK